MARTGRIRNILLATDLQADSRPVLETAGGIAAAAGARLHLLHVLEDERSRGDAGAALREQHAADARRALDIEAERLEGMGVEVASRVCAKGGPAHRKILGRAERTEADLIVLGSHARGGAGTRLGSTADRVLRTSVVPCLVVRGQVRWPFRRVAALVDFSKVARRAIRLAVHWLPALGGGRPPALDLVHVGDDHLHAIDPGIEVMLQRELETDRATALKRAEPGAEVGTRLLWGLRPADPVIAAAAEDYDLLVIGTHGRGPVVRALIGSVALALAQGAPCPVLVVPPAS